MAEIVGVISAGVGITSFAAQVFGSIKALKDTYQYNQKNAPENLNKIIDRLEFLKSVLEILQPYEGNPIVDHAIRSSQSTFRNVEGALHSLMEKVNRKSSRNKVDWKPVKFQLSAKIREQIEEIRSELFWVIMTLNLFVSIILRRSGLLAHISFTLRSNSVCSMPPVSYEKRSERILTIALSQAMWTVLPTTKMTILPIPMAS